MATTDRRQTSRIKLSLFVWAMILSFVGVAAIADGQGLEARTCTDPEACRRAAEANAMRAVSDSLNIADAARAAARAASATTRSAQRAALPRSRPAPVPAQSATQQMTWPIYRARIIGGAGGYNPNALAATFRVKQRRLNGRTTTLIEAPPNPYTKPQTVHNLIQTALDNRDWRIWGGGWCWRSVREALVASGTVPRGTSLEGVGPQDRLRVLTNAKFKNITNAPGTNYLLHPEDAPVGSIIIYEPDSLRGPGDVQIRTEHGYVSDHFAPSSFIQQPAGRHAHVLAVMVKADA